MTNPPKTCECAEPGYVAGLDEGSCLTCGLPIAERPVEGWEKELEDDLYVSYGDEETPPKLARGHKWPESKWELDPDKVKDFIRSLLQSEREEICGLVEGMEKDETLGGIPAMGNRVYNKALTDLLAIIKKRV